VPNEPDPSLDWSTLLGMGAVIAAVLVAGLGHGWLGDTLADTTPIYLHLGLLLGIAAPVSYTVVEIRKYLKS
jgi:F0F1-type ATP synthase assembly protein I